MASLLSPRTWNKGSIKYQGEERAVRWLPGAPRRSYAEAKIGMDEVTGEWYYFNCKTKRWCKTPRLTTLIRALGHMTRTHAAELQSLSEVRRLCREGHLEMLSLDFEAAQGAAGQEVIRKLGQALVRVGTVRDEEKVEGQKRLARVVLFRYKVYDKRIGESVIKMGAALATTLGAINNFRRRVENIQAMDAWIVFYSMMAQRLFVSLEYRLQEALVVLCEILADGDRYIWGTPKKMQRQIAVYHSLIAPLPQFRPFRRAGVRLLSEARAMESARAASNFRELEQLLKKAMVSLQLLKLRTILERSKKHIAGWTQCPTKLKERINAKVLWYRQWADEQDDSNFECPILEDLTQELIKLERALYASEVEQALAALDKCLNMI